MITVKYLKEKMLNIPDDVFVACSDDMIEFVSVADDETETLWGIVITDNEFRDTSSFRNKLVDLMMKEGHPWMK